MRTRLRYFAPPGFLIIASLLVGCIVGDEDVKASEAPTTTGIPMGAPGAVGVRIEPPTPTATTRIPRLEGIEQKINPGPIHPAPEPVIPPSPFGNPPNDEPLPPQPTTKKKPQGTKI